MIVFCIWGLLSCCGNALIGTHICLVLIIFYSLILQRLATVKIMWNFLFWLSILDCFSWCFYLFFYLIIYLFMLQPKREGESRELCLFYLSKCTRKKIKRLYKEIKALKQPRSEFQEQKLRRHVCLPTPSILQHVVFTELAVYSSSPVVRERFVSLEVRESLTSQQNYRYSQGMLIHVWVCAYINITRLFEFIFPQYSLSSSAWNIYILSPEFWGIFYCSSLYVCVLMLVLILL